MWHHIQLTFPADPQQRDISCRWSLQHQCQRAARLTARIRIKTSCFSLHSSEFSPSSCRTRDSRRSVCSMAFFSSSRSLIPACGWTWAVQKERFFSLTAVWSPSCSWGLWPNSKQARLLPLIRFHYNNSPGSNTHTKRDCCKVYASMYWVSDKTARGKIINRTALNSHMREESLSVKVIICYSSWITVYTWLQRDTAETSMETSFWKFRITLALSDTRYTKQLTGDV